MRIEADDRKGLERLLRYYARPPFAADRLEEPDPQVGRFRSHRLPTLLRRGFRRDLTRPRGEGVLRRRQLDFLFF